MDELSTRQVTISDSFWTARLEINSSRAIFHQWEQLEASGCIDNFRIAAGEMDGFREGWFFADSDAYKWLDAAARILATRPDPTLATLVDGLVALLDRTQDADGYLFTYNQIHFPGTRWVNLMIEHELYCHGHLIEAGVSHYQATSKTTMLEIASKAADRVAADFLGKGPAYTPGHEEIEIALLRLYQITGHARYLEIARQFLEQRGRKPQPLFAISLIRQFSAVATRLLFVRKQRQNYLTLHPDYSPKKLPLGNVAKAGHHSTLRWLFSELNGKYLQQHAPIRRQTIPVGHSVRFGYLETAVAMLHRIEGDGTLLPAMEKAWERMVRQRMYITGGIGSIPGLEGFGNDYELDPEYAYAETCAALASLFWNWEMALITGEAKYSDLFEWQLYNAAVVGMGLSGENYLYNNPLTCKGGVTRKTWYTVPCCPSNLSRTWADLGKYIYTSDKDAIWIHQYIGSKATLQTGLQVHIETESGLPWNGKIRIKIEPSTPIMFTIHLRIPSWASNAGEFSPVKVNGEPPAPHIYTLPFVPHPSEPAAQGYDPCRSRFLSIQRIWSPGDVLELDFDMPVILRRAHPKVRGHHNKVAVTRGPLVYCLESTDNAEVDIFSVQLDAASLRPEITSELLDGITILRGQTVDGQPLTFIPYHLWANRGESQITVWINTDLRND
jgi:DUF1680 family protein